MHFDNLPGKMADSLATDQRGRLYLFRSDLSGGIASDTTFEAVGLFTARRWFKAVCAYARKASVCVGFQGDPDFLLD